MYVDVTENYYTLEDDVKLFLYFISQRQGSLFAQRFILKKIYNVSSFVEILIEN